MTTAANFHEYQFSFHGHGLRYKTSSRTLLSSVAAWAHEFRQAELSGEVSLTIQFEEVSSRDVVPLVLSPSSRLLFSGIKPAMGSSMRALCQCDVIQDNGRLVVDVHEQAVLVIQPGRGAVHGYFLRPETMHTDLLESFFHYALAEILKRRNMFTLRVTALEYRGRGLLIPGYSGCGKTTTLLSLLRSGYRYLSEDHLYCGMPARDWSCSRYP